MGNPLSTHVHAADEPVGGLHQYLSFLLQGEAYAIDILHIREIIEYGQVTTVPMVPRFLRGVINLRGAVVPVIDLNIRFGREPSAIDRRTCIVIVETRLDDETHVFGLTVDAVTAVLDISTEDLEPPPTFGSSIRPDYITAMAKQDERFLILLNLPRVLSWDDWNMLRRIQHSETDTGEHPGQRSGPALPPV